MTSGPVKQACGRCGRHGYPAARFPDGYLCGPVPARSPATSAAPAPAAAPPSGHYPAAAPRRRPDLPRLRRASAATSPACAAATKATWPGPAVPPLRPAPRPSPSIFGTCSITPGPAARRRSPGRALAATAAATARWLRTAPHPRPARRPHHRPPPAHPRGPRRPPRGLAPIYLRDLLSAAAPSRPPTGSSPATKAGSTAASPAWPATRTSGCCASSASGTSSPACAPRAATGPLRPTARQYAEQRFIQAENFLSWTAARRPPACRPHPGRYRRLARHRHHAHQSKASAQFPDLGHDQPGHIPALHLPPDPLRPKARPSPSTAGSPCCAATSPTTSVPSGSAPPPASCCSTPSHSAASSA